jgi:hypothetical protein
MTDAGFIYHSIGRAMAEPSVGMTPNLRAIA